MIRHLASRKQLQGSKTMAIVVLTVTTGVILWSAASIALMRYHTPLAFDGDEAHHAMWGATIYLDLAHGDIGSFLRHTYAQNRYPFLYSYFQVPVLAVLGITPFAHRLVGIIFMVALSAVVYLCVVWSRPGPNAWLGGSVAALLAAGCPALYSVASRVYIEPVSLVLMMLAYALYLRAQSTHSTRWAWGAGLVHLVCWFTKWQFGILVSLILVIDILIRAYPRWRKATHDPVVLWMVLPGWITVGMWMANPYQLREFLMYLTAAPKRAGLPAAFIGGMGMQVELIFSNYTATPVAAILTLGGLLYGLVCLRAPEVRVFVLSALVAVAATSYLQGPWVMRAGLWLLPPLWVLVGIAVTHWIGELVCVAHARRPRLAEPLVAATVVLLLAGAITNVAFAQRSVPSKAGVGSLSPSLWRTLDYIVKTVPPDERITTLGCWARRLSPRLVIWGYLAEFGRAGLGYDDVQLWSYPPPDPNARDILHFRWPWRVRLPAKGPPAPPPDPVMVLQRADIDTIVACSKCTEALPSGHQYVLAAATGKLGFRKVGQRRFSECNCHVIIYSRPRM